MITLTKAVEAFGTEVFSEKLKSDIENIDKNLLPLQQGLSLSSYVGPSPFKAIILTTSEQGDTISAKIGIFYTGIIAGCSCSDDPSPVDEQNEYCELQFTINKSNAKTTAKLLDN
ncbi:MAG TPA: hypothetical protein ENJ28_00085 [Gammaproteobacteria bacterium]|nr:hypothetical protein [Gammaproteobacteria bacterium]